MLLSVPCKQGRLQVAEDNHLSVMSFGKVVWLVPCASVTKFSIKYGAMMSFDIAIQTTYGTHVAEIVTQKNFQKLQSLFPHVPTDVVQNATVWKSIVQAAKQSTLYSNATLDLDPFS